MQSVYPLFPEVDNETIEQTLIPELTQSALASGAIIYPKDFSINQPTTIPMTIFPTPLPRKCFQAAIDVQQAYNRLYAKISQNNGGWLAAESERLADFDPEFTGKLWNLYLEAKSQGIVQKVGAGLFRSDYLIDEISNEIKQVEFNTVSVSFAGLSSKVSELHQFLDASGKYTKEGGVFYGHKVPISDSATQFARGLSTTIERYNSIAKVESSIVLMIVQEGERNVFDQRILEYALFNNHGIQTRRLTIHELHKRTKMDPKSRKLYLLPSNQEVGLVYFRAGYTPSDFITKQDWDNRLTLEISLAIKTPNLLTQLSGTKKIQQLLTSKDILTQFVSDEDAEHIFPTFVKMYPLDDSELGHEGKRLAFENPTSYVLKPQREGGGNNVYKEDIPTFLSALPEKDWSGYVLMELIKPRATDDNIIINNGKLIREPLLSELGIYGFVLFDDTSIYNNELAGWLLRSKLSTSNEGGVAAGFGCVDSPVLY